jgi:hypothetical protein
MSSCRAAIKPTEGEPKDAASPLQTSDIAFLNCGKASSGVERSDKFCCNPNVASRLARRAAPRQEHDYVSTEQKSLAVYRESDKFCRKEMAERPTCEPSGSHQEHDDVSTQQSSLAVCREATRKMKRPSGNRTAFSFKGE